MDILEERAVRNRQKQIARRKKVFRQRLLVLCVLAAAAVTAILLIRQKAEADARREAAAAWTEHGVLIHDLAESREKYERAEEAARQKKEEEERQRIEEEKEKGEQAFRDSCVHFVAVGDNLIHSKIYQTQDWENGGCCYDELYAHVRDTISAADLAAVNLETILVADRSRISGYPYFGTPVEIGGALADAGFDIVECATNHTADKLSDGILDTINYFRTSHPEVTLLGIHDSEEDAQTIRVVESKGIRIALLDYTNVMNVETYAEYMPAYFIDLASESRIYEDVAAAKQISDAVIVFLHDGNEYDPYPSDSQRFYVQVCLNAGVDAMICSHSHVLEGFQTVTGENGHSMLVYYGLGNFVSTQTDAICLLEGMADFYIYKNPMTQECEILYPQLVPMVMHYNYGQNYYAVYFLSDYYDALAAQHSIGEVTGEGLTMDYLQYYADIAQQAVY